MWKHFRYLAENEDDNTENNIDPNNDDPEFSLISNGICHDENCESPSVTIRSKMGETIFQTSSTIDDVTIVSEHSRRKRDTEDQEEEHSVLESLITEDSNMNEDDIILQESTLSSNDSLDSQEILNDVQHEYQDEIESNIADRDNKSQVQNNLVLSGPLSLLTDSTHNDFDIILEPIDIDLLIPTTTVKTPTLDDDLGKIIDSDDSVPKKGDIVRDKLEKKDDDSGTPDDDHVPNYDIILNSTDESNILDEMKGFNSEENVGDKDIVQNKVNFDIVFDNSGNKMDDLIDDIKGIVKNNGIKNSDNRNEESMNLNNKSEDIDNESIFKVESNNKDNKDVFNSQDDDSRVEKENLFDDITFHVSVKSDDDVGDHDNNTDSEEEDASGVRLIHDVDDDVKDNISRILDFQLNSSIDTSKEDLNDSTNDLNNTESGVKNKEMQIPGGDDVFKIQDDDSREEKENLLDDISFHVSVKSDDDVGDHENNTDSEEEDASGVRFIQHVDDDVKDNISKIVDFQLDSSIDTSKEDLNDSTNDSNYTESDVKSKEMQISVGEDKVDTSQDREDTSATDNVYVTDSTSEESNETGISVDTKYDDISSSDDTSKDKDVLSVNIMTNESSRTDSSKDPVSKKLFISLDYHKNYI